VIGEATDANFSFALEAQPLVVAANGIHVIVKKSRGLCRRKV
jgi:hypothetical protein